MIDILTEWLGRLLIKVGRDLVDYSRSRNYERVTRIRYTHPRDRYY